MHYFPDKFAKTVPPKQYLWQVFAKIKQLEYQNVTELAKVRIIDLKKIIRNDIKVTDKALEVFREFIVDDIDLLSKIK